MGCGGGKAAKPPAPAPAPAPPRTSVVPRCIAATGPAPVAVAVVLPGGYNKLLVPHQTYSFHVLDQPSFSMGLHWSFDADSFVESAIEYCKDKEIKGVFGFDCFPSLIASIINTSLGLPGPSFQSVFHCINKYYMRKALSPEVSMTKLDLQAAPPPASYPVVVKESDSQFYLGTWIIENEKQWHDTMKHLQSRPQAEYDARKKFYWKWFQKLHPEAMPESSWEELVLQHVEPYFEGPEHQIEIVLEQDHHLLVADTGDIIKKHGIVVMFVTPGSFEMPTAWAHDVTQKLHNLGYRNQAIDLEFIFTKDGPQLVEINSRYSYMGFHSWYTVQSDKSQLMHKPDLRNLENRVCSCVGLPVPKFPSDQNVISKLAVAVYTNQHGKVEDIVDLEYLKRFVADGHAECWIPKPAFAAGMVEDKEFTYGGGEWAKLGFMMLTAKRVDFEQTNAKLQEMFQKLFKVPNSYLLAQDDEIGYEVDKHALDY